MALLVAYNLHINEVCIFFNDKLLRGNRSRKMDPWAIDAFDSPNFQPLAEMGVSMTVKRGMWNALICVYMYVCMVYIGTCMNMYVPKY